MCVYGKDTLYIVCVLGKQIYQKTWRVGEEICACLRDKVIRDLYWGPYFRREEGGAQGDKVCLFAVGVVCEVSVQEPHN